MTSSEDEESNAMKANRFASNVLPHFGNATAINLLLLQHGPSKQEHVLHPPPVAKLLSSPATTILLLHDLSPLCPRWEGTLISGFSNSGWRKVLPFFHATLVRPSPYPTSLHYLTFLFRSFLLESDAAQTWPRLISPSHQAPAPCYFFSCREYPV